MWEYECVCEGVIMGVAVGCRKQAYTDEARSSVIDVMG